MWRHLPKEKRFQKIGLLLGGAEQLETCCTKTKMYKQAFEYARV
jgi:hypothetical protein